MKYIGKCLLIRERGLKILVIGDLHLGYEESLNRNGVFVGRAMYEEMIEYFEKIFSKIKKVDKIILLGDVKHVFGKILWQEKDNFSKLIIYFFNKIGKSGNVIVVKGNHDKINMGKSEQKIRIVDYYIFGGYCFMHGDRDFSEAWNESVSKK